MTGTQTVWSALPFPALILDAHDQVTDVNSVAEEFFNASRNALIGAKVLSETHCDVDLVPVIARARTEAVPFTAAGVLIEVRGMTPVVCDVDINVLEQETGHILALLRPQDTAMRFGKRSSPEAAALSAIGMAEMLAHEIKNPLAGIKGAAQLLSMNLEPDGVELTNLIVSETKRILGLLGQVEQFGNLLPPNRKPVNIHDVLDRARQSASVGFGRHMVFVENYDPSLPLTYADLDQLVQVILNLLKNAAEAQKVSGTIWLRTFYDHALRRRQDKDGQQHSLPLQVEIIDDGPGLPAAIEDQIFDPFVSGRENGTGLGLALVSKIVADHDGWISVTSNPGKTVFRISLPVADDFLEKEAS